jgi:hypothetical protein
MISFKPEHVEPILEGRKTQTRRLGKKRWNVGAIHHCRTRLFDGEPFACVRITAVRRERLGDISDGDIAREGYATRADYRAAWEAIYGSSWNDDMEVWVVDFKLAAQKRSNGRSG